MNGPLGYERRKGMQEQERYVAEETDMDIGQIKVFSPLANFQTLWLTLACISLTQMLMAAVDRVYQLLLHHYGI